MSPDSIAYRRFLALMLLAIPSLALAQKPPYDVFPAADAPYYRVRYEASTEPGELAFAVNYTVWIPQGVKTLRGVVVHQHGCGEGSCKSGLTGAYDLHWQALAKKPRRPDVDLRPRSRHAPGRGADQDPGACHEDCRRPLRAARPVPDV